MKPLPLLLTLTGIALLGASLLILKKPSDHTTQNSSNTKPLAPLPQAPLPFDYEEPELPLPKPPILEFDLVPDPQLISFVEEYLGLNFTEPPIFDPVPAEEIITTIEKGIAGHFPAEQLDKLNITFQRLGALPSFQQIDQNVTTILAAETRGLITPTRNLILNDFESSSPPEQAALVHLLAQRLLSENIPFPQIGTSIDKAIARHFIVQSLALNTEKEFRKTLPSYPASLNENLRESILLGLPAFFHELATFSEFHLFEKSQTTSPSKAAKFLEKLATKSATPSRDLLAFPFASEPSLDSSGEPSSLGAIPLYLFLLEATDPTTARTLATSLTGDTIQFRDGSLFWTLNFETKKSSPRVAEFFRSYFSLRDAERKININVEGEKLIIIAAP